MLPVGKNKVAFCLSLLSQSKCNVGINKQKLVEIKLKFSFLFFKHITLATLAKPVILSFTMSQI